MAYTYDDFVKAANSAGRLNRFGQADLEAVKKNPEYGLSMLNFMKDEEEADNDEARMLAGAAMEQLRKNYGVAAPSSADYDDKQVTGLLEDDGVVGAFQYDPETDPNMAAYRKMYLREGERATADALAQASAATGGIPSSHAVTAATQAGNYYAAQLADKVPELRAQAYQEYLDRERLKQQQLENQRYDEKQEYDNALSMWGYLGYATPEIARILGVEEGAKPAGVSSKGGTSSVDPYTAAKNQQEMYDMLSKSLAEGFDANNAQSWRTDIDSKVSQGLLTEHQAQLLKYTIDSKVAVVQKENYERIYKEISGSYSPTRAAELSDEVVALFAKGLLSQTDADKLLTILEGDEGGPGGPGGDTGTGAWANNSQVATPWNPGKIPGGERSQMNI